MVLFCIAWRFCFWRVCRISGTLGPYILTSSMGDIDGIFSYPGTRQEEVLLWLNNGLLVVLL